MNATFGVILKTSSHLRSQKFYPMFSSSFIVLGFIFRSMIHFKDFFFHIRCQVWIKFLIFGGLIAKTTFEGSVT